MANSSVTGVVLTFTLLFFTFPLCYARLRPTSLPENGINIETDFPISLLDSDVNQIIRLPIDESEYRLADILPEKETGTFEITDMQQANETGINDLATKLPESEIVEKLPESESENVTSEVSEKLPEMETVTVKSMPLGIARFRPANRPCHHRHHRHHHLFPHSGNMLLPTGENGDFDRVIIHKQLHRIPQRLSSVPYLHHHHHENEESNSMFKRSARFNKDKFNKHFHHHDHHEDHEHEEKSFNMNVKNQKLDNNKDNGLLHRIRKMMINF